MSLVNPLAGLSDGIRSNSGTPMDETEHEAITKASDELAQSSTPNETNAHSRSNSWQLESNKPGKYEPTSTKKTHQHSRAKSMDQQTKRKRRTSSSHQSRLKNELEALPATSPTQVYRNLLTIEESLRQQYSEQALSRRKHILFFSALIQATFYFSYAVFVQPSIYRLFSFFQRIGFVATIISLGLFYLTGLYRKTFVDSPRFMHTANKGLRPFNLKIVKTSPTWKERIISWAWNPAYTTSPGGLVKIVLSSRSFTSETIEGWDIYRQEYWEREHERIKRKNGTKTQQRRKRAMSTKSAIRP